MLCLTLCEENRLKHLTKGAEDIIWTYKRKWRRVGKEHFHNLRLLNNIRVLAARVDRDSVVGIATGYGLDGPLIELRLGRGIPYSTRPALGPTQPPVQWVPSLLPGGKAAGAWRWPPTLSSAEVKESVELYF
jgi:hypothetical protein